jgi:hypothetical protein
MWKWLGEHQSVADQRGYGAAWKIMCEERTAEAAKNAALTARGATYGAGQPMARKINAAARAAEAAYAAIVESQSAMTSDRIVWEEIESVRICTLIAVA